MHIKRFIDFDSSGNALYEDKQINFVGRYEPVIKRIVNAQGEEVTSQGKLICETPIYASDMLVDGKTERSIISASPMLDVFSDLDHYEGYV